MTMILTTTLTIDSDYVRDIQKERFIHSFKCVYMLKDYPIFKESDFEYLRGKIQRQTKRRFTYENCGYL